MPLKIIGTGLGRTGTHSLKLALEMLGFGKCYHMHELFQHPGDLKYFKAASQGKEVNWDELFSNYNSGVDYPVASYYKELYEYYPGAKVIHNVRDAESWYESASKTILKISSPFAPSVLKKAIHLPFSKVARSRIPVLLYNRKIAIRQFGSDFSDKERIIEAFNKHNEEVIRTIPSNKLLLFKPSDGWKHLCEFLEVHVPKEDYPRTNTPEEFYRTVDIIGSGGFLEDGRIPK